MILWCKTDFKIKMVIIKKINSLIFLNLENAGKINIVKDKQANGM